MRAVTIDCPTCLAMAEQPDPIGQLEVEITPERPSANCPGGRSVTVVSGTCDHWLHHESEVYESAMHRLAEEADAGDPMAP